MNYVSIVFRPDLKVVSFLSEMFKNPPVQNSTLAKIFHGYLKNIIELGIVFNHEKKLKLVCF